MPTDEIENHTAYGNQGAQKKLQGISSFACVLKTNQYSHAVTQNR